MYVHRSHTPIVPYLFFQLQPGNGNTAVKPSPQPDLCATGQTNVCLYPTRTRASLILLISNQTAAASNRRHTRIPSQMYVYVPLEWGSFLMLLISNQTAAMSNHRHTQTLL